MLEAALRKRITLICMSVFLTACGGGSGDSVQASGSSGDAKLAPVGSDFYGVMRTAPPDGATISGIVRLDFFGRNIRNLEVLPETGATPKYGRFNVVDDPRSAGEVDLWMDLDTTKLPNGPIKVRFVAFDVPAGQQPTNQSVILTRTWNIDNSTTPGTLAVSSVNAPGNGTVMSGIRRLEVRGNGLANVELLPASGYSPKLGVFNVSTDRTYAWLDFDTKTQADGLQNVRISAFNAMAGQSGAREIVAMSSRQWNFQNRLGSFRANSIIAPVNGAIISGNYLHIEVRGTGIENVELLPSTGYTPKLGRVEITPDKTLANVYADISELPKGMNALRVSAFNKPAGDPTAQEIVVMPARQLDIR
jgi:hypothetical protein